MLKRCFTIFLIGGLLQSWVFPSFLCSYSKIESPQNIYQQFEILQRKYRDTLPVCNLGRAAIGKIEFWGSIEKNQLVYLLFSNHQSFLFLEYQKKSVSSLNALAGEMLRAPLVTADPACAALTIAAPMMAQSLLGEEWQLQAIYKEEQLYVQDSSGKIFPLQDKFCSDFGVRSLWQDFTRACLNAGQFGNRLKSQGYQVRFVDGRAFLFRGLLGGGTAEDKEEIDYNICNNASKNMKIKLPSLSPAMLQYLWESLFKNNAGQAVVKVVLRFCLMKTKTDEKELNHLVQLISTNDRERSLDQIITSFLYEAQRSDWNAEPCRLRRDLLILIDFDKKFTY